MRTIEDICIFLQIKQKGKGTIYDFVDDTRKLKKNNGLIVKKSAEKYINNDVKRKAKIILYEEEIPLLKGKVLSFLLWFYRLKLRDFLFIGVTGTTGKSSTSYLIHEHILDSYLFTNVKGIKNSYYIENTTPYNFSLIEGLLEAKKKKKTVIILELSSIAMSELRINEIYFNFIILLNLESDHLDYHKTIGNYHNAKVKYISKFGKTNIINSKLKEQFEFKNAIYFEPYNEEIKKLFVNEYELIFESNYAAVNMLLSKIDSKKYKVTKLHYVEPLIGRMMVVKQKPLIIIDYAHTAVAFENALSMFKNREGSLIVVFGCGGNRDKEKRSIIGQIVLKYADVPIVTEDNSRKEELENIISNIVGKDYEKFVVIKMRSEAIRYAIKIAKPNDVVLIMGKGHEDMLIGINTIHFSDIEEVKKWM